MAQKSRSQSPRPPSEANVAPASSPNTARLATAQPTVAGRNQPWPLRSTAQPAVSIMARITTAVYDAAAVCPLMTRGLHVPEQGATPTTIEPGAVAPTSTVTSRLTATRRCSP